MKKLFAILFAFVALSFAPGCKSPERTAFVAVGSVGTTANAAIGAYSEWIKTHPQTADEKAAVHQAVQAYVNAMEASRAAVTAYKSGTGTKDTVDLTLDAISAASANVVALITSILQPGQ